MEYVAFLKFRESVSAADQDAALMRRAAWKYPDGIRVISEYWPLSAEYQVVTAFEADSLPVDHGSRLRMERRLRISVSPAVSADEGFRVGPEVFGRPPSDATTYGDLTFAPPERGRPRPAGRRARVMATIGSTCWCPYLRGAAPAPATGTGSRGWESANGPPSQPV